MSEIIDSPTKHGQIFLIGLKFFGGYQLFIRVVDIYSPTKRGQIILIGLKKFLVVYQCWYMSKLINSATKCGRIFLIGLKKNLLGYISAGICPKSLIVHGRIFLIGLNIFLGVYKCWFMFKIVNSATKIYTMLITKRVSCYERWSNIFHWP